jgi:hypothetical protein
MKGKEFRGKQSCPVLVISQNFLGENEENYKKTPVGIASN